MLKIPEEVHICCIPRIFHGRKNAKNQVPHTLAWVLDLEEKLNQERVTGLFQKVEDL